MTQARACHYISSTSCQQLSLIIQKYPTISAKITIRIIDQSIAVSQRFGYKPNTPEEFYGADETREERCSADIAGRTVRDARSRFLVAEVAFESCASNKWR